MDALTSPFSKLPGLCFTYVCSGLEGRNFVRTRSLSRFHRKWADPFFVEMLVRSLMKRMEVLQRSRGFVHSEHAERGRVDFIQQSRDEIQMLASHREVGVEKIITLVRCIRQDSYGVGMSTLCALDASARMRQTLECLSLCALAQLAEKIDMDTCTFTVPPAPRLSDILRSPRCPCARDLSSTFSMSVMPPSPRDATPRKNLWPGWFAGQWRAPPAETDSPRSLCSTDSPRGPPADGPGGLLLDELRMIRQESEQTFDFCRMWMKSPNESLHAFLSIWV